MVDGFAVHECPVSEDPEQSPVGILPRVDHSHQQPAAITSAPAAPTTDSPGVVAQPATSPAACRTFTTSRFSVIPDAAPEPTAAVPAPAAQVAPAPEPTAGPHVQGQAPRFGMAATPPAAYPGRPSLSPPTARAPVRSAGEMSRVAGDLWILA